MSRSGLTWSEDFRRRGVRLAAYVERRCIRCGMWRAHGGPEPHGYLFGPFCNVEQRTGRRRYRSVAFVGGTWVRPETLPPDIAELLGELAAEARTRRESLYRILEPAE